MAEDLIAYSLSEHPNRNRGGVGLAALFYGLFMAPFAWATDLLLDYALIGHGCYPGQFPLGNPSPGFGWVHPGVLGFHLGALVLIASGIFVAYRCWSRSGGSEDFRHHLIRRGEGRTRYLGIVGMGFGAMFFLITTAETISLALVSLCTY